ncbi:MAG: hypothetical protein HYR48_02520, partial [Gemmatimonadetes bacterium]|nr:hypothetical protein [Gemmatimonadota bacterium]
MGLLVLLAAWPPDRLTAQAPQSRLWRPEDRALVTDLSRVTALAATPSLLYVATIGGLAIYDRVFMSWRETLGAVDGFPGGPIAAMAADPGDDTAWLGGVGRWIMYQPVGRRWDSGPLPGRVDDVVLDARDPSRGAYFHTSGGWYFVPRGGVSAEPAVEVPGPGRRVASLTMAQLLARAPALDLVRMRIERDDQLRAYRMTAAATVPVTNEVFIATSGNGVFRVDLTTYALDRLPSGLLSPAAGGVAVRQGEVCAGTDTRFTGGRRGVACLREDLTTPSYYEGPGLVGIPGNIVRRLVITPRALWAATDQGALRIDRRSGEVWRLVARDGLPSDDVWALAAAPGGVWIGTSLGLAFAPDTDARAPVTPLTTLGAAVRALAYHADTLWIGSAIGLGVLLPGEAQPVATVGPVMLRDPIVAIALKAETLVVASEVRLAVRAGGAWRVVDPPGPPVGRMTAVVADREGFWVAGTAGFAFYQPARNFWNALT